MILYGLLSYLSFFNRSCYCICMILNKYVLVDRPYTRFCNGRSSTTFDDLIFSHLAVASVAQLVELLICNQSAGGSSPSAGSNDMSADFDGGVPERPKGTDCKSVGDAFGGSNPPPSTKPR